MHRRHPEVRGAPRTRAPVAPGARRHRWPPIPMIRNCDLETVVTRGGSDDRHRDASVHRLEPPNAARFGRYRASIGYPKRCGAVEGWTLELCATAHFAHGENLATPESGSPGPRNGGQQTLVRPPPGSACPPRCRSPLGTPRARSHRRAGPPRVPRTAQPTAAVPTKVWRARGRSLGRDPRDALLRAATLLAFGHRSCARVAVDVPFVAVPP